MKILKIIHTLGHGGAENAFRWLAWGLLREGVDVTAAIPGFSQSGTENWLAPALEKAGIPYVTFDAGGSPLRLLRNLSAVIDRMRPDLVHSHLLDANVYSAILCRLKSISHICTEHGDVGVKTSVKSRRKYAALSRASHRIVCVSEAVRLKAMAAIQAQKKLDVIYNGIHFMERSDSSFRREFGIDTNAVVIGNVGNLYPVKGQATLLRAFAGVCHKYPQSRLVLVGRGAEEATLRRLVATLGITDSQVIFTGFRPDIENILNALDLYVQPSLSEGHPLAVIEAMSLGLPVIASDVGGIPEITCREQFATLVKPESPDELQRRLLEFLATPDSFRCKGIAGRTFVRQEFSIERMTGRYRECYRDVLT